MREIPKDRMVLLVGIFIVLSILFFPILKLIYFMIFRSKGEFDEEGH